ncbi:MAG: S-layer homology domain-containing protein [Butyricicoccus sp.]|nr:S-layer homology domain-containing protein [Butyricicoccus sp.]
MNVKKVLALVLAFAMAFTMMATAGAAYTDQADIQATEAVDTLNALGVMTGDPDGSFRPNDTITRAEACRMIYTIRSGGNDDASAYAGMQTTFTDVPNDAWYAGYVKHCQSVGIVSGKSSTIFDPNANVTGVELALMCLRVMGYDPEKANIGGSTWSTTTIGLATEAGLLEDFNATVTNDCPRQYAAQLMYNMLNADTVRWSDDANGYVKDEQRISGTTLTEYITVGEKYMSLIKVTGTLLASGKVGLNGAASEEALALDEDSLSAADAGKAYSFDDVTTDYSDMIGQTVQVLYKEKNDKNTVYGVFATDDNKVNISTTANNLESVSGEDKIKVDGTNYTVNYKGGAGNDELPIYVVKANGTSTIVDDTVYTVKNATNLKSAIDTLDDNGVDVQVISNDGDSKVDMIIVFDKTFAKLTAANSSSVTYRTVKTDMSGDTISGSGAQLDLEDDTPTIYDGYAKDDYVFVSADLYNDVVVIEKAEVVTGEASATKTDSIEVGGTWYDYYGYQTYNNPSSGTATYNAKAGNSYNVYVLNGFAYYIEGSSATDVDTLLVKSVGDYNKMNEGIEAKVLFEDGTEKIINVEAVVTPTTGFNQDDYDEDEAAPTTWTVKKGETDMDTHESAVLPAPALYTYDVDGSDYTLFVINQYYTSGSKLTGVNAGDYDYNSKTETIASNDVDDAAVIYLNYGTDDWKVVTGETLSTYDDITAANSKSAYITDDGTIVAAFLCTTDKLSSGDTLYGVVTSVSSRYNTAGDKRVVYLDLITPEGEQTVETEETSTSKFTKGDIVSFSGTYTLATGDVTIESDVFNKAATSSADAQGFIAIDRVSASNLITPVSGLYAYGDADKDGGITPGKIVSDSTVIYVDQDNSTYKYVESDDISEADYYVTDEVAGDMYANAYMIVDDDNEVVLLVYATNGKIRNGSDEFVEMMTTAVNGSLEVGSWSGSLTAKTVGSATATITTDLSGTATAAVYNDGTEVAATGLTASVAGTTLTVTADATVAAGDYDVVVTLGNEKVTKTITVDTIKISTLTPDSVAAPTSSGLTSSATAPTITFTDATYGTLVTATATGEWAETDVGGSDGTWETSDKATATYTLAITDSNYEFDTSVTVDDSAMNSPDSATVSGNTLTIVYTLQS